MTILKSIVCCLALANVAYFLWEHGIAQGGGPAGSSTASLRLVSEVTATPAAATLAAGAGTAAPATAAATASGDMAGSNAVAREAATALPAIGTKRCLTVGPFRDVSEAAHAATLLRGAGYDPRQRVVDGELWAGVWVYLRQPATAAATEQLLARLKSAGIEDALEMPGPDDASVVSLGLFSEQKRAQLRMAQAVQLGLAPLLVDRKRTAAVYWIELDLKSTDASLNPADLQGEPGRISRLEVKTCPAPAAVP